MVNTYNRRADAEAAQPNGAPLPPPNLAQAIASIIDSRVEQTELLRLLVANSTCGGDGDGNVRDKAQSTYVEFLATQPPTFAEAGEMLEAAKWLRTIEFMFRFLHRTED
jgi:hypothetical protein